MGFNSAFKGLKTTY